jgi:hypothetical protein
VDAPNNAGNHNGGTLRFGKDGMLYSSLGEDAVRCAAQDSVSLRGVILRLDVTRLPSGGGGPPAKSLITPLSGNPFSFHPNPNARLVWLLGLRNPFRFQVDQPTGDLYITDVGENTWEEIDRAPVGGMNFGWPDFEGPAPLSNSCTDANSNFTAPIGYYNRSGFTASIIGAGVYHRAATGADRFPPLYEGNYFYNDYFDGFLRRMKGSGNSWSAAPSVPGQPNGTDWGLGFEHVSDWATGPTGALWYVKQSDENYSEDTGEIHKIVFPQPLSAPDEAPALLLPLIASPAVETARFPFALASPGRVTIAALRPDRQTGAHVDRWRNARGGPQTPVFWDGRDASGRLAGAESTWCG